MRLEERQRKRRVQDSVPFRGRGIYGERNEDWLNIEV